MNYHRIEWQEFTKSELVEILTLLQEETWHVQKLSATQAELFSLDCTCDVHPAPLPDRIAEIRDATLRRRQGGSPVTQFLRRSFRPRALKERTG